MNKNYRRDCFAFNDGTGKYKCNALTEIICKNKTECPFYKSKTQEFKELGNFGTIDNACEAYRLAKEGYFA